MPNLLSQATVARNWGVSRQYVHQCVQKGMLLDSLENCRLWREAHASKRQTTSPVQLARLLAEEADDDSTAARERRKKHFEDKPNSTRLPFEDSLDDALFMARQAASESWRLLREAMVEGRDIKIGVRLNIFNKALEGRFRAEQSYREEKERRSILIELNKAQHWARKAFDVILSRLAALPQNIASRVNPLNPHHAMDLLEAECTEILADAQQAFTAPV
jgi:hypothetical protein